MPVVGVARISKDFLTLIGQARYLLIGERAEAEFRTEAHENRCDVLIIRRPIP